MNLDGKTLLVRADASEIIGAGHIMRCLALAQTWREFGGRVVFVCCSLPDVFAQRLSAEQMEVCFLDAKTESVEDGQQSLQVARKEKVTAILVDLYQARDSYLASLSDPGWKVLCLDDNAELPAYPVDIILNLNGHARASQYESKSQARLLLGPSYALLRREFKPYRNTVRNLEGSGDRLIISFGGGNQVPALVQLIEKLAHVLKGLKLSFVLARPDFDRSPLEAVLQSHALSFKWIISPLNMAEELARHDLLISSGGSTVWESLFMGIPAIFIAIAENQNGSCLALTQMVRNPVFASLDEVSAKAVESFVHDRELQGSLARTGRSLVDGYGAERVIEAFTIQ